MLNTLLKIITSNGRPNATALIILQTLGVVNPSELNVLTPDTIKVTVDGYYHEEINEVFTLSMVSEGRLVRFEVSKDGNTMSVVLPIQSIRRCLLETAPLLDNNGTPVGTSARCVVEIGADQQQIGLEEIQIPTVDEQGGDGFITRLVGFSSPSGFTFVAREQDKVAELIDFYSVLSRNLFSK